MAKKKNAPILRGQSEGGDQPITTTVTKSYAVRDKWLDNAKDNLVEFKSVDGEISDLKVNGEPAGGGGMKTCTVNMVNESQSTVKVYLPTIMNEFPTINIIGVIELEPRMDIDKQVVMNQEGETSGSFSTGQYTASGSGNVEVFGSNIFVRGNGSISFT